MLKNPKQFILAGNAYFTVDNGKGEHFTYRVSLAMTITLLAFSTSTLLQSLLDPITPATIRIWALLTVAIRIGSRTKHYALPREVR